MLRLGGFSIRELKIWASVSQVGWADLLLGDHQLTADRGVLHSWEERKENEGEEEKKEETDRYISGIAPSDVEACKNLPGFFLSSSSDKFLEFS